MTDLILLLLGGAGLSVVVTMSTMFSPVRELFAQKENEGKVRAWFRYMINCPRCFGVYAGAGMYGIMLIPDVGHWSFRVCGIHHVIHYSQECGLALLNVLNWGFGPRIRGVHYLYRTLFNNLVFGFWTNSHGEIFVFLAVTQCRFRL